ncbi:MAG: NTP transferase domain-containing protein [bacterium]
METTSQIDNNRVAKIQGLNSEISHRESSLAIILAAGHGKRIRSSTSKMLHKIWGKTTVERVSNVTRTGLNCLNQVIVVGIKAEQVAQELGRSEQRLFTYQEHQRGTGDAVRVALDAAPGFSGDVYIFPGDTGLVTTGLISKFKTDFDDSRSDMMVLTGLYEGDANENCYGRILRVPQCDRDGQSSGEDAGNVIEIMEHKDVLALVQDVPYKVEYRGKVYAFLKKELLELREFNTGLFAFKADKLRKHITDLKTNNVQGELYVTDLIRIFNENGLSVRASATPDMRAVLGFNTKSVLKEMERCARETVYEKIKDRVLIEDKDDFFIADEVVEWILKNDDDKKPLDICIGKGAHIDREVVLARGVTIGNHSYLSGKIDLGEGVRIKENVQLICDADEAIEVGANSSIGRGNILKGCVCLGQNCRIESGVVITGATETPTFIGNNVVVLGISNIANSVIEDDFFIEHSVLHLENVRNTEKKGGLSSVKFAFPHAEGLHFMSPISNNGSQPEFSERPATEKVN